MAEVSGKQSSQTSGNQTPANVRPTTNLNVISTAEVGGPTRDFPTGSLVLYFGAQPPTGQHVDFTSVQSIANNSQITVSNQTVAPTNSNPGQVTGTVAPYNMGSASPYTGWNKKSKGHWLEATGGAVPAVSSAKLVSSPSGDYRERASDDPSVVLSFSIYDWLRHSYLRPNISAVASGLSSPLNGLNSGSQSSAWNNGFLQPAYAASGNIHPATFGISKVPLDGEGDPRDASNFDQHPDGTRRMVANVFGYTAAAQTLPDSMLITTMQNGQTQTTNGQPASVLFDLWNAIHNTDDNAGASAKAAQTVIKQQTNIMTTTQQQLEKVAPDAAKSGVSSDPQIQALITQRNNAMTLLGRAYKVFKNASYAANMSVAMLNDRKTITGLGVTKVSSDHFKLIAGDYYPINSAATTNQILGTGPISTGQNSAVKNPDWATPPVKNVSQLTLYTTTSSPTVGNSNDGNTFIEPALAATAVPQNTMFEFTIVGDVNTSTSAGIVNQTVLSAAPYGANVLNGQSMYQNTAGFVSADPNELAQCLNAQAWNCVTRDNAASDAGAYYADSSDPGYNGLSLDNFPLIAEWTMRCPAPISAAAAAGANSSCCAARQALGVSSSVSNGSWGAQNGVLSEVEAKVDSAGNVTYYWHGAPFGQNYPDGPTNQMHFIDNAKLWQQQLAQVSSSAWMYGSTLDDSTANYSQYGQYTDSNGNVSFPDWTWNASQYQDWYKQYGQPITKAIKNGFYQGDVTSGGGSNAVPANMYQLSVYDAEMFYTGVPDTNCAQLYYWSS